MDKSDLEARIISSIANSSYLWRTASGIAGELKVPEAKVVETMKKSDSFVRSKALNQNGKILYTTSERYKRNTPLLTRFLGAGANTVSS